VTITFAPGQSPDDAAKALREMSARAKDLGPVLRAQSEMILRLIRDSFRNSRGPDGTPWKPLAQSTIDKRRRGSSKPLEDTGALRDGNSVTAGRMDLTIGTNVPYAGAQNFGATKSGTLKRKSGTRPAGTPWTTKIPARAFLPFTIAGTLIEIGPSALVFDRLARAVGTYITTGRTA